MYPIYICYDSELSSLDREAVKSAVDEICAKFNRQVIIYGDNAWSDPTKGFSSADWYVKKAKEYMPNQTQLNARLLIELMRHEPWQDANPHIDMILVSDDLTAEHNGDWLNFCFGLTCGRFVANSVHRYKSLNDLERFLAVKAVVLHEIGHVLGAAADLNRSHTEEKIGPHCTNPNCVMRQGLNLATWVKHARECNSHGSWYCPQCLADIKNSQI